MPLSRPVRALRFQHSEPQAVPCGRTEFDQQWIRWETPVHLHTFIITLAKLNSMKPTILDLFCGAGGAAMGYNMAGFNVVGVDISPQPNYPFEFIQADAMEFDLSGWNYIHASPPCQKYSIASRCNPHLMDTYPDLVVPLRSRLRASGAKYVMENVPGAPLANPVMLCGMMFGLELYRHRLFEYNWWRLPQPPACRHLREVGTIPSVAGRIGNKIGAERAMGVEGGWMTRRELTQAIPPAYTAYVGQYLLSSA